MLRARLPRPSFAPLPHAIVANSTHARATRAPWCAACDQPTRLPPRGSRGHLRCARVLIDAGAKLSATDASGRTPAALAYSHVQLDMHEMLTVGVLNDSEAEKGQKAAAVASLAMAVGQRLPEGLPPGHMACHLMVMEERDLDKTALKCDTSPASSFSSPLRPPADSPPMHAAPLLIPKPVSQLV